MKRGNPRPVPAPLHIHLHEYTELGEHFAGSPRGAQESLDLTGPIKDLRVQTPTVDALGHIASGVLLALSSCPPPLRGHTAQWHSALRPPSVCLPTPPSAKAAGDSQSSSYRGRSAAPNCGSKPSDGASSGARRLRKEAKEGREMPGGMPGEASGRGGQDPRVPTRGSGVTRV